MKDDNGAQADALMGVFGYTRVSSDRDLLKMAAKAAGIDCTMTQPFVGLKIRDGNLWNPLEDDGDALRLAVQLEIGLHWCISGRVYAHTQCGVETCESSREDRLSNLRRAIVRAAAAIGESL